MIQLSRYYILFTLFGYLLLMSYLFTQQTHNSMMLNLMGLFFIIFSFFKVIHLKKFQKSFSRYDIFSKLVPPYGYVYPFIELLLGVFFILGYQLELTTVLTIVILTSTTIGVIDKLRKQQIIECACLGSVFNLPLSQVTVFENTAMIVMSVIILL